MKIILLTQWYPPEPANLIGALAESIQQAGHKITVLTGFPNYPSGEIYPGYKIKLWQREEIGGVPVIRFPLYPNHDQSSLKRALNYTSFSQSVAMLAPWLAQKPDVIHVYSPPLTSAWPGWLLSRWWKVPFTYEIQDLWPETLKATGMLNNERMLRLIGWFADRVYRRAAAIRVISPGFRENLISKGVPAEKIHVISNWVDADQQPPQAPDPQLAASLGLAGRFNVMFAGTQGFAQGLDTVLAAAVQLQDMPQVQIVFVGSGADSDRLHQICQQRAISNVKFLGRFPSEEMPRMYALADVLLVHLRADPLFRITIPHKIFDYLSSGKPVLAAMEGDSAAVITQANAGLICPPGDPPALAEAVRRFAAMSDAERLSLGANGRRLVVEEYNRPRLAGQVIEMLESVMRKTTPIRNR
jgi:glycosyltransferase involved in cell wall biosynthesis